MIKNCKLGFFEKKNVVFCIKNMQKIKKYPILTKNASKKCKKCKKMITKLLKKIT